MPMIAFLLAAAAPQAAPAAIPRASGDPVALFKEACLGPGARLAHGTAVSTSYGALPPGARLALGQALYHAAGKPIVAPPDTDVPNQMFRLVATDTYLLVPITVADPQAAYADSCTVVWKGGDFAAAYHAALPDGAALAASALPAANSGAAYQSGANNGRDVVVAEWGGWTVLKSVPTPTPPTIDQ